MNDKMKNMAIDRRFIGINYSSNKNIKEIFLKMMIISKE